MLISINPESREHAWTIFDIIRIFLPRLTWQELIGETGLKGLILDIRVTKIQIEVKILGKEEELVEPIIVNDANEVKRTIKLAVYKLLKSFFRHKGSPWGILTGIRPTKIVHRLWERGLSEEEIRYILQSNYQVSLEKIDILIETTKLQKPYLVPGTGLNKVSIYLSIPFCPTRCNYCSFPSFSLVQWGKNIPEYLENLKMEIKEVGQALKSQGINVETIYMGGGTPTTLTSKQLANLIEVINTYLFSEKTREFTIEAGRPDTLNKEKLEVMKDLGVGRVSINPQTMWEPTLEKIGRAHTVQEIFTQMELARKIGFKVINMDLIIGLPDENLEVFKYTLQAIEFLKPENLTLHTLAIKRAAQLRENTRNLTAYEEVEKMFAFFEEWRSKNYYQPYYLYRQKQMLANLENVGYSLPGYPCIYNIQMMEEKQTIWGLGVGAGSKVINSLDGTFVNSYNPKDILLYSQRLKEIIKVKVDKIKALG